MQKSGQTRSVASPTPAQLPVTSSVLVTSFPSRFAQVAFTGDDALLAELEKGIVAGNAAMEVAGGDAA